MADGAVFSIYDKECAPDILRAVCRRFPKLGFKVTVASGVTGGTRAFVVQGDVTVEELNSVVAEVEKEIEYPCSRFQPGDSHPDIPW
ncbi:MAG: hypothetical protein WC250_03335 [Candidatus Paceibacterota bacterium]|jgi:hypothetical protein